MMLDKFDRFERFSFLEGIKATIRNSPRQFPIPPGVQMPGPERGRPSRIGILERRLTRR